MIDLLISALTLATSMNWASSRPAPAQPDADRIRLGRSAWPSRALMSAGIEALLSRGDDPPYNPPITGGLSAPPYPPRPAGGAQRVEGDRAHGVPADQVGAE